MLNLANFIYRLDVLLLISVLFLFVSCILCFGSVGQVLSEFLPSVTQDLVRVFRCVSCPLWVSHGLLCVKIVVCVPSFVYALYRLNLCVSFHYICNRLKCVFTSFSGSLFIFNYVITFGKVKNYKALFSRLHRLLPVLKVSFRGVNV